jgi:hypothetical protein
MNHELVKCPVRYARTDPGEPDTDGDDILDPDDVMPCFANDGVSISHDLVDEKMKPYLEPETQAYTQKLTAIETVQDIHIHLTLVTSQSSLTYPTT